MKTTEKQRNIQIYNEYKMTGNMQEVGNKYGLTRQRVFQIVSRFGYRKPRTPKITPEKRAEIRNAYKEDRFWERVNKAAGGCWEWTGLKHPTGYGRVQWDGSGGYAHRAVWVIKYGAIPDGMHICHRCDNPGCVNPDHLFLGTVADNMHDRDNKGRNRYGENRPSLKLIKTENS